MASALALAAAAFVGRDRFVERPHLFSLAGEVAALAAIDALGERAGASAARAAAWFLAAVVVWANLHAGVFVAPLMVGAVRGRRRCRARSGAGARRLGLCAVGSAVATLATPVGFGLSSVICACTSRSPRFIPSTSFGRRAGSPTPR